uniref:(northern house mosquito) hypothetical protein n=1 Tax=Culex pipiens TaxID=7175 RepID=A0A8D8GV37_CULPI
MVGGFAAKFGLRDHPGQLQHLVPVLEPGEAAPIPAGSNERRSAHALAALFQQRQQSRHGRSQPPSPPRISSPSSSAPSPAAAAPPSLVAAQSAGVSACPALSALATTAQSSIACNPL